MRGLEFMKRSGDGQKYIIEGLKDIAWIVLVTGIDYSCFLEKYRITGILKNLLELNFVSGFMLTVAFRTLGSHMPIILFSL